MNRDWLIGVLQAHEHDLRAAGVGSVSLFGLVARGERPTLDVDVVVRLGKNFSEPGPDYFSRMDAATSAASETATWPSDSPVPGFRVSTN